MNTEGDELIIRQLGLQSYQPVWQAMKTFTQNRTPAVCDELWILQHHPVFTQGQAGKAEHVLNSHTIPVVQTDRGGQVTYHGPGQLVAYPLLNLQKQDLHIRALVTRLEQVVISMLAAFDISAEARRDAPGVYVENQKICSIGLRVSRGCSYHGIALNVDMDLKPFSFINPCGFAGLQMTQVKNFRPDVYFNQIMNRFIDSFLQHFRYTEIRSNDFLGVLDEPG
jgi:lipoyl(octanoyl) transferase